MNFRGSRRRFAAMRVVVPIGSTLRFERRIKRRYLQSKPGDHLTEHVIGEKTQTVLDELNRYMPVSEVIGGLCDQQRITAHRLEQGFVCGYDLEYPAVLEPHLLSPAQQPAAFNDPSSLFAIVHSQEQSALAAGLESQVSVKCGRWLHG
jgi:hypothetical protein